MSDSDFDDCPINKYKVFLCFKHRIPRNNVMEEEQSSEVDGSQVDDDLVPLNLVFSYFYLINVDGW